MNPSTVLGGALCCRTTQLLRPSTHQGPWVLAVAKAVIPEWHGVRVFGQSLAQSIRELEDVHLAAQLRHNHSFQREYASLASHRQSDKSGIFATRLRPA